MDIFHTIITTMPTLIHSKWEGTLGYYTELKSSVIDTEEFSSSGTTSVP
jgi:hypothetical protein